MLSLVVDADLLCDSNLAANVVFLREQVIMVLAGGGYPIVDG